LHAGGRTSEADAIDNSTSELILRASIGGGAVNDGRALRPDLDAVGSYAKDEM
jgi:hypothetical protein